jgi:hypothetical protein
MHQSKRFDPNPLVTGTPTNQRFDTISSRLLIGGLVA